MQGEQGISQYQFTQFEYANIQTKVDAVRLLVYRAAQAKQDHEPFSHLAAMGKLYAAEAVTNVTRRKNFTKKLLITFGKELLVFHALFTKCLATF